MRHTDETDATEASMLIWGAANVLKWAVASLAGCHACTGPVAAGSFCICTLYSWQQLGSLGGSFHTNSRITFRWWNSDFLFWPRPQCVQGFQQQMTQENRLTCGCGSVIRRSRNSDTSQQTHADVTTLLTSVCIFLDLEEPASRIFVVVGGSPCCVFLNHSSGWKRSDA